MANEDEIVLYTNPMSRGLIAHWMLEEVGAPYRTVILDFEKREHKTPDFLELNPMGKVPTIVHRVIVITESAAIFARVWQLLRHAQRSRASHRAWPIRVGRPLITHI